jgi:tetratricopeptide (TPR) repeat protein
VVARRALAAGAVALVVVATGVAVSRVLRTPITVVPANTVRSLAVVPAMDSADTTRRWLERGIALEVERALRGVSGLRVVSATATARVPRRRLTELLNVGSMLETRITTGPMLKIQATLRGENDSTLLHREYATTANDLLEAEDALARDVANILRAQVGLPAIGRLQGSGTRSRPAHEYALRALVLQSRADAASLRAAATLLDSAVRLDSSYGEAWAARARIADVSGDYDRAAVDAQRAIALDTASAEPHVVLGDVLWSRRNATGAEREYRTAIRFDPQLARARHRYAVILFELGRRGEAIREARRAHELDPLSGDLHAAYAQMLARAGRHVEADHEMAELRRIRAILEPSTARPTARKRTNHGKTTSRGRSRRSVRD